MNLPQAVSCGSRLDALRVLRDDTAERMAVCSSDQNFAVMARVLLDVMSQIEAVTGQSQQKGTALDELAARRGARRPNAAAKPGTAGPAQ